MRKLYLRTPLIIGVLLVMGAAVTALWQTRADEPAVIPAIRATSVHAAGRGTPLISLSDGLDLPAVYEGESEAVRALATDSARAQAMASADFDGDGMMDLVVAYATPDGGALALHRGNPDAIFPHSAEAALRRASGEFVDAPFWPDVRVFSGAAPIDFIVTGDFNADGNQDAVTAARGAARLTLWVGDGSGELREARQIDLPGGVTALAADYINRTAGPRGIAVAVEAPEGARLIVFDSPARENVAPESFALPRAATELAIGRLDGDSIPDILAAAGEELVAVYGRDLRSHPGEAARVAKRAIAGGVRAIEIGDFNGDQRPDIALVNGEGRVQRLFGKAAKANARKRKPDTIDRWKLENLAPDRFPQATQIRRAHVARSGGDDLVVVDPETRRLHIITPRGATLPAAHVVPLDVESSPLAALPMRLNRDALDDLVVVRDGNSEPAAVVTPAMMTFTVTTTDDGVGIGSLRDAINDANNTPGADIIEFNIGEGPVTLNITSPLPPITEAVTIDGTTQPGFADNPIVALNFADAGPMTAGLNVNGPNMVIRGLVIQNVAGDAIRLTNCNESIIELNFIGLTINGASAQPNAGVGLNVLNSTNVRIGNPLAPGRNVIAASGQSGIQFSGGGNHLVVSNLIGTNSTGTGALGNGGAGVRIIGAQSTQVGAPATGPSNVIMNNGAGVIIEAGATDVRLENNFVGLALGGDPAVGNAGPGILIADSPANAVGPNNTISRNQGDGVRITGAASIGNIIGNNFIGTGINGDTPLGNDGNGVRIDSAAANNLVFRNVIASNDLGGVQIAGSGSTNNQVQGNSIGRGADGATALGNGGPGVLVTLGASGNLIGHPTLVNNGNVIAHNTGPGIAVRGGSRRNRLLTNRIFNNIGLGIDLGDVGPTPNDLCDADSGDNDLQNAPVLNEIITSPNGGTIVATLRGEPGEVHTIQFFIDETCHPSGFGASRAFIGQRTVTVGEDCLVTFTFSPPPFDGTILTLEGVVVTMTATDTQGNTSEFSACNIVPLIDADLTLAQTASAPNARPGELLTFTHTILNQGPDDAPSVTLLVTLPLALEFVSCEATGGGICGAAVGDRTVTFESIQATASATATITARVKEGVADGTVLTVRSRVFSLAQDPQLDDNVAQVVVAVGDQPPGLICPSDQFVTLPAGQTSVVVNYPDPVLPGNPPGVTIVCVPPSGSAFPLGVTTVNCTANGPSGPISSCSFRVIVAAGGASVDRLDVDFGQPINVPAGNPPSETVTITNNLGEPLTLTLSQIVRVGADVTSGRITNPDDRANYPVMLIGAGGVETPVNVGSAVTLGGGQEQRLRIIFNPPIPPVAGAVSGLAARQVLPDLVTSQLVLLQAGGAPLRIGLTGRVAPGLKLINPDNPRNAPRVTFSRSGDRFVLTYSIFDANRNTNRARYEFLDAQGNAVGQAIEVDLAQALAQTDLLRGQSFTVEQPFNGAASNPQVASVRLTVSDGETSVTATASLGASGAAAMRLRRAARATVTLPRIDLTSRP